MRSATPDGSVAANDSTRSRGDGITAPSRGEVMAIDGGASSELENVVRVSSAEGPNVARRVSLA